MTAQQFSEAFYLLPANVQDRIRHLKPEDTPDSLTFPERCELFLAFGPEWVEHVFGKIQSCASPSNQR